LLADGLLTLVHQDGADRSEDQRDRSDNNTTDLMILIAVPLRRPPAERPTAGVSTSLAALEQDGKLRPPPAAFSARVLGFFNHVRTMSNEKRSP